MFLFDPDIRFFWEGPWSHNRVELRRRLYDCEFVYVSSGHYLLDIAGERHAMRRGSIAIIPPDCWHESRTTATGSTLRHCIHFDWLPRKSPASHPIDCVFGDPYRRDLIGEVPVYVSQFLPLVSHRREHAGVIPLVETMLTHMRQKDPGARYLFWPVLRNLLALREERVPLPLTGKTSHAVLTVREHIHRHFAQPQGYADYRQLTGLSRSHLCQAFSAMVGLPPLKYLTAVRLQHACGMLHETSPHNIGEVAAAVGIPDANYFCRLFRSRFKQSPSAFMASGTRPGT